MAISATMMGEGWRRAISLFLGAILLISLPGTAIAHPVMPLWYWKTQPSGTYSYWIYVCDTGFSGSAQSRLIDAINEWDEINGELHYTWTNYSDATCTSVFNGASHVVKLRWGPISGVALGQTFDELDSTLVDDCDIVIDNDGTQTYAGSYSWYSGTGSPGAGQIDLESVLVHELGHCVDIDGHSNESGYDVMYGCLHPTICPGGNPEGIEKDELTTHDKGLYSVLYGTSH